MDTRYTAQLPDGTRARSAWIVWMIAGVVVGGMTVSVTISLAIIDELIARILGITIGPVLGLGISAVEAFLLAAVLYLIGVFAVRRLLMPQAVWLAMLAAPTFLVALSIPTALGGVYGGLVFCLQAFATVGLAWFFVRRRAVAADAQVTDPAGVSV